MTDGNFATKSEAKRTAKRNLRVGASLPLVALFAVVSLIAAFAYGISAWQVYGFAAHVWGLPEPLRIASAVIADLLSLAGLFATYLLRSAAKRVRAYAWFVFLLMTALSIAAAESFAHWRTLDEAAQIIATHRGGFAAQVASGAVVVSLTLAVHLLIVVRRHVSPEDASPPEVKTPAPTKSTRHVVTPAEQDAGRAPVTERPARPAVAPGSISRRVKAQVSARSGGQDHMVAAQRVVDDGERTKDVAAELGVTPRSVQNWVKELTELRSTVSAKPQVNGHEFTPGAATEAQVN
jgi:hypothetical protein